MAEEKQKIKDRIDKPFYIFLGFLAFLILIVIISPSVFSTPYSSPYVCFAYENETCDRDNDCPINKVCITEFTMPTIYSLCEAAPYIIIMSKDNDCKRGFCARIKSDTIVKNSNGSNTILTRYVKKATEIARPIENCPVKETISKPIVDIDSPLLDANDSFSQEDNNTGNISDLNKFNSSKIIILILGILLIITIIWVIILKIKSRKEYKCCPRCGSDFIKKKQLFFDKEYNYYWQCSKCGEVFGKIKK